MNSYYIDLNRDASKKLLSMIKDQTFDSNIVERKSTRTLSLDAGKNSKDQIETFTSS